MKIDIGNWEHPLEVNIVADSFYDEFVRGPDGRCALCQGDPCNEHSPAESLIAQFWAHNPDASSCPVCDGRPT